MVVRILMSVGNLWSSERRGKLACLFRVVTQTCVEDMKGVNIEAKASAALTVKGNAKAEISAAGNTIVKGAMVMIN